MRTQVLVTAGIFVGYWALQMFVPVPGHVPGQFKEGALLSDWIYWHTIGLLPKPWASPWHGGDVITLTTHGATAMLGVFATYIITGKWRSPLTRDIPPASREAPGVLDTTKLLWLVGLGLGCLLVGWLWSFHLPIVKNRWTSTFVLWGGGTVTLLKDVYDAEAPLISGHGMMSETSLVLAINRPWVDLDRVSRIKESPLSHQLKDQSTERLDAIRTANAGYGNKLLDLAADRLAKLAKEKLA